MSSQPNGIDLEALLAQALAPVDPPEHLIGDLEERLNRISGIAADEIDAWEAGAFHDPRTWVRPATALAVGTAAAGAAAGPVVFARKAIDTIGNEVTRRLGS